MINAAIFHFANMMGKANLSVVHEAMFSRGLRVNVGPDPKLTCGEPDMHKLLFFKL